MIRGATRGRRVVRLKGGDPFVLGRGGEEALALAAAGIPFEIVPGLTAAVTAPGLSGIPVTHRGVSSAFVVVSGHAETAYRPVLEAIAPGSLTLVILMGLAARRSLSRALVERGWPARTPVALCLAAGTPRAWTWFGTLEMLAAIPAVDESGDVPGTIVIGEVVSVGIDLAAALAASAPTQPASQAV
jgi:uroporphyrin-III C-methyltransferase/precorrin-2 dehydrogenase/sirohydrochlorin ferrochelatase